MLTHNWFVECCREITKQKRNIWIAYSGGVDSHVLLQLAVTNLSNVRAIHINHNLDKDDDLWQQHCEKVCADLNVPLTCIKVDGKASAKQSPEDAARRARRKAWQNLLSMDDVLLVAHHAEDQAETILYRIFRGTGPKGLCGMLQYSRLGTSVIFRPLLTVAKREILNYAHQQQLIWLEDATNSNISFARNFIRNQVVPLLTKRWPAITENVNRAGDLCSQLLQIVDPVINEKLASIYGASNVEIDLSKLQQFSDYIKIELLRAWLHIHGLTPSLNQLSLIQKQVIAAKIDASPQFVMSSKIIRRSNNKLYILEYSAEYKPVVFECVWDLNSVLKLPSGHMLQPAQFSSLAGQEIIVKLGSHGRKAKKIFQQYNIPPWDRAKYPLILANDKLVAIIGLWMKG